MEQSIEELKVQKQKIKKDMDELVLLQEGLCGHVQEYCPLH